MSQHTQEPAKGNKTQAIIVDKSENSCQIMQKFVQPFTSIGLVQVYRPIMQQLGTDLPTPVPPGGSQSHGPFTLIMLGRGPLPNLSSRVPGPIRPHPNHVWGPLHCPCLLCVREAEALDSKTSHFKKNQTDRCSILKSNDSGKGLTNIDTYVSIHEMGEGQFQILHGIFSYKSEKTIVVFLKFK